MNCKLHSAIAACLFCLFAAGCTTAPKITLDPLTNYTPFGGFVFTVNNNAKIAAPYLALVLPLPGEFKGLVKRDDAIIGIAIGEGRDYTTDIATDTASFSSKPSDVTISWGEPSPYFGTLYSETPIEIPIMVNPKTGDQTTGWEEGMLSLLKKDGRRLILKGTLQLPLFDYLTLAQTDVIEYQFAENSAIRWDQRLSQLNWSNMAVRKIPIPAEKPSSAR